MKLSYLAIGSMYSYRWWDYEFTYGISNTWDSDIIKFVITVINGVHRPDSEYKFG